MKNEKIVRLILDRYYEQKMTAEYELQLTKLVEKENEFCKGFSKEKAKKYLQFTIEQGKLEQIELEQILDLAVDIIKDVLTLR